MQVPNTTIAEAEEFGEFMASCPKSGLHNPLKNPDRYNMYGRVCQKVSAELDKEEVFGFFSKLI
jgi:1-pyrroline-5-carboxylate dehydrogenase